MRDLNINLKKSIVDYNKLSKFGFSKEKDVYKYKEQILESEFEVQIFIEKDKKYSKVIDIESNEEYALVDIEDAVGEFIGTVRSEYEKVINKFLKECTKKEIFKSKQSKEIIKYVKERYGDELEFLWDDDNAIWRSKKNNKWYATIFTVSGDRLGINSSKIIEVSNVMYEKDKVQDIIDNKTIFPAYHMNKRSWITIKLDDEIDMETVYELIDNSYEICNNKH